MDLKVGTSLALEQEILFKALIKVHFSPTDKKEDQKNCWTNTHLKALNMRLDNFFYTSLHSFLMGKQLESKFHSNNSVNADFSFNIEIKETLSSNPKL